MAVIWALPLLCPQLALLLEGVAIIPEAWVIVVVCVLVQLFASVTVTMYSPAAKPVAVVVVCVPVHE